MKLTYVHGRVSCSTSSMTEVAESQPQTLASQLFKQHIVGALISPRITFPINLTASCPLSLSSLRSPNMLDMFLFFHGMVILSSRCHRLRFWKVLVKQFERTWSCYWVVSVCSLGAVMRLGGGAENDTAVNKQLQ